jgi:hypothetical protein
VICKSEGGKGRRGKKEESSGSGRVGGDEWSGGTSENGPGSSRDDGRLAAIRTADSVAVGRVRVVEFRDSLGLVRCFNTRFSGCPPHGSRLILISGPREGNTASRGDGGRLLLLFSWMESRLWPLNQFPFCT